MSVVEQSIAHYNLLEHLGAGGLGDVYRARDTKVGRTVALKLLPAETPGTPARGEIPGGRSERLVQIGAIRNRFGAGCSCNRQRIGVAANYCDAINRPARFRRGEDVAVHRDDELSPCSRGERSVEASLRPIEVPYRDQGVEHASA